MDFDKAIALKPDDANAYNNRGDAYYHLKDYNQAILDFDKAIALKPDYAYAHNNRANLHRKRNKLAQAKTDVQKSLSLDDENGWAYATLAMIHADEGDVELFYKNLKTAISKPLAYPLKEKLAEEETLQRFKGEQRFMALLKESEE